jgi:ribonuclease-3
MSLSRLEKNIGYCFKNPSYLTLALTHRSVGDKNNERLEFLGDSLLNLIIAETLFTRLPNSTEGELSRIRANYVNKISLANIAKNMDLGDYVILGSGELKSGGFRRESILADTLEAIIAAIYLDSHFDGCKQCVLSWFVESLANIPSLMTQKDPKTILQEYLQARRMDLPIYTVLNIIGKDHEQQFEVLCQVTALSHEAMGRGSSRRRAEQEAAEQVLQGLKHD